VSTILEKITQAVNARESITLRVGRQKIGLYCAERSGNPYWTLSWYEGAQRCRKTATEPAKAIRMTEAVAESVATVGRATPSVLGQPSEVASIPLNELLEFYKKHHPDLKETFNAPTVSEIRDEFLSAAKNAGRSQRHLQSLRAHLNKFCLACPKKISQISVEDINPFLQQFAALKTRLNYRITLISFFRFAQRRGFLPTDRLTAAELSDKPSVRPTEPEVFTSEEFARLLKHCDNKKIRAFLVFGGLCGLRSAEIARLRWENVREDHIILGAAITKTARRRVAEIPGNAAAWLEALRETSGPVSYLSPNQLYKKLDALAEAAGVSWKPNALRHSFASYHLEFHRDPPRTSKTAGHSLRMLETVYAKLVSRNDAIAWFSIFPIQQQNTSRNL
jgi:integrase